MFSPAFTIAGYLCCSCSMIVLNKAILSTYEFPYPFLLIGIHMGMATLVTQVLQKCGGLDSMQERKVTFQIYTQQIMPIAFLFSVTLICGNQSYIYLSISFVQMLKACTPICVLILSIMMGLEQASKVQLGLVGALSLGVVISTAGEQHFNATGFAYELISIIAEALRLTLSDRLLKTLKLDAVSMLYYVAPLGFAGIMIGFVLLELPAFLEDDAMVKLDSGRLPGMLLASSLVAFACNLASVQLIRITSAVVLSLVGVLKDLLILFFSVVIFRSPVTIVQMCSYGATLVVMLLYKEYKHNPKEFASRLDGILLRVGIGPEEGVFARWALHEENEAHKVERSGLMLAWAGTPKAKHSEERLHDDDVELNKQAVSQ